MADPTLARNSAAELERHNLTLSGGREVASYLARPAKKPTPAVILVHEWWGLNNQITNVARELAQEGFLELAVDLMDGRVATTRNDTKRLMGRVGRTETLELSRKLLRWLKAHPDSNGRIATLGWCFGGGWALSAATVEPDDAAAVYHGRVNHRTGELRHLKGPVMGHFATHNMWINRDIVTLFELGMLRAGKRSIS